MRSNSKEYFLIFDTNVLYQSYEQKADFTRFSFNATYENTVGMINQLDIYEKVTIAIPDVVWNEMTKQIIDAHRTKLIDFESRIQKWKFPEYSHSKNYVESFQTYIQEKIASYKEEISSGINKVIGLPLPSDNCFKAIVKRAFDKKPPFIGKEKNSDKGFKDVLIWESILEFASSHTSANILFYSRDNGFKEELTEEFNTLNQEANLSICFSEDEVKEQLDLWAKEIDIYAYQPITEYVEHSEFIGWIETGDFEIQLVDRDFGLVEKSSIITETSVRLIDYDNIQVLDNTSDKKRYLSDVTLEVKYIFKSGIEVIEDITASISVVDDGDANYLVEDVYRLDENTEEANTENEV